MILRALWLRPMLERPLRFAATVLGVAIGVAAVVSTALASRAAVASMGADVAEIAGGAALEIRRPGGVEAKDLTALRELCGEVLFAPVVEDRALVPALGDLTRLLGVDLLLDPGVRPFELGLEEPAGGVDASAASPRGASPREAPAPGASSEPLDEMLLGRGVALSEELAAELGVGVGDPLRVIVGSRPVELVVAARLEPRRFASVWDRVLLVDVALAQELTGRAGRYDRVQVRPRTAVEPGALAAGLRARLAPEYTVGPVSERREEGERMVRALDFNLTALSGVSLLVGVVLVATTLATSVVQRRGAIALLRSLGASRGQLAAAVLTEAGLIGLLGGALGVLLGSLGARAALASVRTSVATLAPQNLAGTLELDVSWGVLGVALGLGSSLAAAVLPLREAVRVPPIQGLRGEHPESVARRAWRGRALAFAVLVAAAALVLRLPPWGERPVWALAAALLILATLLVLSAPLVDLCAALRLRVLGRRVATSIRVAQAALEAGRRRAAWAAGAVGVAVGLAVSMATMIGSFRQTVVAWTEETMRSDLFVRPLVAASGASAGRIEAEVVEVAERLFGAEAVDPYRSAHAYVDGQRVELAGAELAVVAREGGVPFLDGRPSTDVVTEVLRRGGAVVNESFARRFDVAPGSPIELETAAGTVTREVAGVYRDYSGHMGRVVLDRSDFLSLYPDEGVQSVAIFLPPERDVEAARRELEGALGGRFALDVLENREVRREVLEVFERTFAVTVALQLVAAAVAGIAVVTVLGALVRERRTELAVVRVLGGSPVQVAGVVLGEALLLGLAGAVGGLGVGLAVGWVLVAVVNVQSFGWTLEFLPPWGSIAATVGLVIPACLAAGLLPALLSLRSTPREVLRELA